MRHISNFLTILFGVTFFAAQAFAQDTAQEGPLESLLDVYLVQSVTADDGSEIEELVAAEEAAPGDTLEYVLSYRNRGEQALQGFVIKNRIPESTRYVGDSDQADVGSDYLVSIDYGVTWEDVPVTRTVTDSSGAERTIVIPPTQYTNISWRVNDSLPPGESFELRYRVTVE